jgi:hypothetical protein
MPPVRITEISETRKCLDMKHVDGNNVQRLMSVIGDKKNNVVEKHVTYKSPWNMPRLWHEYDRDGDADEKRNEDNKDDMECQWCHNCPCVWSSNRNGMIEWDENEHGHLASVDLPSNSTRCKYLYRQMALTISEGPLGKGKRIVFPDCVKDGIRSLLPEDEEGKYMGHKDEWRVE